MIEPVRILFLEDNLLDLELVSALLLEEGLNFKLDHVQSRATFEDAFKKQNYDVILSDYSIPGYSGYAALQHVRSQSPYLPFILLSGTLSEEQAVESLKSGATDYIIKQRLHRLAPAIRRALEEAETTAALNRSEERIRNQAALLDKARDAIVLVDMEQRILYWNKSAERIFGWTEEEARGRHIGELLVKGGLADGDNVLKKLMLESEWRGELPIHTKTGRKIVVESRWTLMLEGESQRPKGILLINTDITDKKEIEAQFLRTQRIETIGSLSGGIAHDLNNALSPIIMAGELLADDITSESGQRMLDMVRSSAKRCAEMVKQILSFSRGAGHVSEALNACKIIEELASLARETFPRLIHVEVDCQGNLHPFRGNLTQLHQVLMNLLVNARDAMPNGGLLKMSARNVSLRNKTNKMLAKPASGAFVSISVSDTGGGIPPEILDRIFEPFFTTKEPGKGTGLGLSTVFSIVKAHDGFLELHNQMGHGATFELFFPAQAVEEFDEEKMPVPFADSAGERILLVEDEEGLSAIVKNTLETFGYKVLAATDGLAALDLLEKQGSEIDLVVTDWIMPWMSGTELVGRIRALVPSLPILVVTGSGLMEPEKFASLPVQGTLQKPYTTEALLAGVQAALKARMEKEALQPVG